MINALLALGFLVLAGASLRTLADNADAKALALPIACMVSWYLYHIGCITGDNFPPPELVKILESVSLYSLVVLSYQLWVGGIYDLA